MKALTNPIARVSVIALLGMSVAVAHSQAGPAAPATSIAASTPAPTSFEAVRREPVASRRSVGLTLPSRGRRATAERLLIVPGPDTTAQEIASLTEDLAIMARIIEYKLQQALAASGADLGGAGASVALDNLMSSLLARQRTPSAEAAYLDGYGALFLSSVPFPLVAPAAQSAPDQDQPQGGDAVWLRTRDQLFGGEQGSRRAADQQPYSAEAVQALKTAMAESLRHAANIRALQPQEWATVVVAEETEGGRTASTYGHAITELDREVPAPNSEDQRGADAVGTLVIRARKSDVDDFAEGRLSAEQFHSKAEIVLSYAYVRGRGGWEPPGDELLYDELLNRNRR